MSAHWTLDQCNMMKAGDVTEAERAELVEHLLGCDACATRFRMMNDLDASLKKQEKHPVRYFIGVAAVMFMAVYPYFTTPEKPVQSNPEMIASAQFNILSQVEQVNFKSAVSQWADGTSVDDLLRMQNR